MAAPMDNDVKENKTVKSESMNVDSGSNGEVPDKGYAFILGTASVSLLVGFGASLYSARRKDAGVFKRLATQHAVPDDGVQLATKALAYGTVLSVSSCGLLVYGVFKLFGVDDFRGFSIKLREYFPKKESQGRSDFKDLRDLADYLVSQARQDDIEKKKKLNSKDKS